jgi:tryptophan halogenase
LNDRLIRPNRIGSVVIVGGGTAGWMAASLLVRLLPRGTHVRLIESEDIGTVGVGEATIPQIKLFNQALGLDENDFIAATQGTIKLGIEFQNWGQLGASYIHAFGLIGMDLGSVPFHHYWLRARAQKLIEGAEANLWAYCANDAAARAERFDRVEQIAGGRLGPLGYAFHFDAGLYAAYLRRYAERLGVVRTEGRIVGHTLNSETGHVESVTLASGEWVAGDMYIDCSGFVGLLIEQALNAGYEDWSQFLPANRAWAVPSQNTRAPRPYTQSIARQAGWQWRIPLQHRTGNGHVFCNSFINEEAARDVLLANLEGKPLAEPRLLKFVTGRRKSIWKHNVLALGLASGFMEPLESTSIHLVQSCLARFIAMFPAQGFDAAEIAEYNRQTALEFERIRDFLVLHYSATTRTDSVFWTHCRTMARPDSLTSRLELWAPHGRIYRQPEDLFHDPAWLQVLVGQGVMPNSYHPFADALSDADLSEFLGNIRKVIGRTVAGLPSHQAWLASHARAPELQVS